MPRVVSRFTFRFTGHFVVNIFLIVVSNQPVMVVLWVVSDSPKTNVKIAVEEHPVVPVVVLAPNVKERDCAG